MAASIDSTNPLLTPSASSSDAELPADSTLTTDSTDDEARGPIAVPPTGGSGHSPNLATLSQVRAYRRSALISPNHRRRGRGSVAGCTGA